MNIRSILLASIAGALSVTAPAMAQDCTFIPGNKVLQEQGASDARIMSFLNDMGPARSEQRTDVKHFAARIAATMATKPELYKAITPSCFTPERLADGFLKVNGLSGTLTDSQFAARVRSTGFTLPTMAVAPAPAPAQPAPAPAAVAAQPAPQPAPVNTAVTDALRSNIGELERKLAALQARPTVTLTPAERQQLADLPGQIQQAVDARAGSETHANAAAASATTAETHAGTAARASASALGSKEAAAASALAAGASATEAQKNGWAVWTALGLAILALLGFFLNFFMKAGRGQVKALHRSVSDMKEMVGDIRLPKGWYDELNKAPLNADLAVNVMVGDGHGPLTPRFVIRLYKAEEDSVVITSGINGRAGDSIKIAGLEILVRQSGFRSQLTETVAPVSEVAA